MPSSLHRRVEVMRVPDKKLAGLATVCFFCVLPYAAAQSSTTHYRSQSSTTHYSTHYNSASHVHGVGQKTHSVPSSLAPEVVGKPSGTAATSANKELDRLERGNVAKPMSVKSAASPGSAKSTLEPEKHSAPINFAHKELPQSPHSGPKKTR